MCGKREGKWIWTLLAVLLLVLLPAHAEKLAEQNDRAAGTPVTEEAADQEGQTVEPLVAEELPDGLEERYTVVYGDPESWEGFWADLEQVFGDTEKLTFASGDEDILTVRETEGLQAVKAGEAQLTVTVPAETAGEPAVSYLLQIVVEKGIQTISGLEDSYCVTFERGKTWDWSSAATSGDGALHFASSDPAVAAADENTGLITLQGAGTAVITVTAEETACFREAVFVSTIQVDKGEQAIGGIQASYTVRYQQGKTYDWGKMMTLTGDGRVTYTSSNPAVATVDPDTGLIAQKGVGITQITITVAETANYNKLTFTSTIQIIKGTQKIDGIKTSCAVYYKTGKTYDWGKAVKLTGDGKVTFASSNPKVATVDPNTGIITQQGVGTTVITITAAETANYNKLTFTSTIQIVKGIQNIGGIKTSCAVYYKKGKTYDWGKAVKLTGDGKVTFASSNPKVATVDPNTGIITQQGVGTTVITITASETANYNKQVFYAKITIKQLQVVSGVENSYTVRYAAGKAYNWGKYMKTTGNGALTYVSSNPNVAVVDSTTGVITLKGVGTTTITVTAAETSWYFKASFQSTITVTKGKQVISGLKTTYSVYYRYGKTYNWNQMMTFVGEGARTYTSSNPEVISVDAKTGVLTQKGVGSATITIKVAATPNYKAAVFTSVVNVCKLPAQLGGIKTAYAVPFVNGKTYNWGKMLTAATDGAPVFTSSNPAVATVDQKTGLITMKGIGQTTITIRTPETATYQAGVFTSVITSCGGVERYSFSNAYQNGPYYNKLMSVKTGYGQRADILAVARSQVGYQEGSSTSGYSGTTGGSGNYTEFGYWYWRNVDSSDVFYKGAWCSMFVSWCANEAGIPQSVIPPRALVQYMKNSFTSMGEYYTWNQTECGGGSKTIRPGDLIFYSATRTGRYNHIGLVTSVVRSGSRVTINTIEGNVDDVCCTRRWSLSTSSGGVIDSSHYIRGFGCPNYSS